MRRIRDAVTASFQNLEFVIEAFLKTAVLAVEKIICDFVAPVRQGIEVTA